MFSGRVWSSLKGPSEGSRKLWVVPAQPGGHKIESVELFTERSSLCGHMQGAMVGGLHKGLWKEVW